MNQIYAFPLETLPLDKFCELTGWQPAAIRQKIYRAEWAEKQEFCYDPNHRIHIILKGYDKWAQSGSGRESSHAAAA